MVRIALDAGLPAAQGDFSGVWEGALAAAETQDREVLIFAPESAAAPSRSAPSTSAARDRVRLVPAAKSAPAAEDAPASLLRACEAVAQGKADALVSCSTPRAVLAAALPVLKRLRGVLKPALAARIATRSGTSLLIDAGANTDSKSWHLLQYALMGHCLARATLGIDSPSAGILSSEAGDGKGGALAAETAPLLKYSGVRFAGVAQARALIFGGFDVIVCDGLLGRAALEITEGMFDSSFEMLESAVASGAFAGLTRRMLAGALGRARSSAPSPVHPALTLLGVDASAVICRGRTSQSVHASLAAAADLVRGQTKDRIRERVEDVKTSMDVARALE